MLQVHDICQSSSFINEAIVKWNSSNLVSMKLEFHIILGYFLENV